MAPTPATASGGALNKGCKRCGNVAKTGLKCVQCGTLTHKACCEKLKIKQIDEYSINCCDKEGLADGDDLDSLPIPSAEVPDKTASVGCEYSEVYYLKELLKHKDVIIRNQGIVISSLQEQIAMFKTNVYMSPASSSDSKSEKTDEMFPYARVAATVKSSSEGYRPAVNLPFTDSSSMTTVSGRGRLPCARVDKQKVKVVNRPISADAVKDAIENVEARDKMRQIINIESDAKIAHQSNDSAVNRTTGAHSNRSKPIVGKKIFKDNPMALKAADRKAFLHVYKLHPETEITTLISYLSPIFPEVKIERMNARYPQYYSSFKVEIDFANVDKAMNPDLWPVGTCINRFFHRKKTLDAPT